MLLRTHQQYITSCRAVAPDKPSERDAAQDRTPFYDPRLKWARPEWIRPQHDSTKPRNGGPTATNSSQNTPLLKPKQQTLINRVTYGSYSSTDSEDDYYRGGDSWQDEEQYPQLFQALGIDFGVHRLGIAVRRSSYNIPLLTLHRQQARTSHSTGSSSADAQQANNQIQQKHKQSRKQQQQQHSIISLQRTAAVVLHLALQEGCDGFIVGLPVYNDQRQPLHLDAETAAAQQSQQEHMKRLHSTIQAFALQLANLAAPLQLPVLLVNEQQSSQQARAVMSGAAVYDIRTEHDLQQSLQDSSRLQPQQQQQQQAKQQQAKQQRMGKQKRQQQIHKIGRDAFAAALILSRYYNGLVQPMEQVMPESVPGSNSSSVGGEKQQQQAVSDLKQMLVPLGEQRRRQKQRQRSAAAEATKAVTDAASILSTKPQSTEA